MKALPHTVEEVLSHYIFAEYSTDFLFIKNMAHHIERIDLSFAYKLSNLFLIRSPYQLISSFAKIIPDPTMRDIGVKAQWNIYNDLIEHNADVLVVDSNELLKDPSKVLNEVCGRLEIPFDEAMLNWAAGPRKEDGVWANYWYENVHRSTGWKKQRKKDRILPEHMIPLSETAKVYYEKMYEQSIKA